MIPSLQFPLPGGRALYEQYKRQAAIALKMQTVGLCVDRYRLWQHRKAAEKRYERFKDIWVRVTGVEDLGKDGQTDAVKAWFWEVKKCPIVSRDKHSKAPKLDTNGALLNYLTDIEDEQVNQAAAALIGYRKAAKAISFCEEYDVDKVHPMFNVTGTKGARWSASGPNIQQLPSKDVYYDFGDGPELVAANMKDIIVPHPGYVFLGSDYSALELYLQTYLAGASKLLEWISRGEDLHLGNARIFYGEKRVPLTATKKSHKKEREVGKLAFGFSYNTTEHVGTTLKQMRGKDPELTEKLVIEMRRRYFAAHPEFLAWQKRSMQQIDENGYGEVGLMGRRLYLEPSVRGHNQYQNAQCQTLGGDMLVLALLKLDPQLAAFGARICLTWHDSLITEVPIAEAPINAVGAAVVSAMEGPFPVNGLQARFVAEPDLGMNLKDMIPLPDFQKWITAG